MKESFLKNYMYVCEQITTSNNRFPLLAGLENLNQLEMSRCLESINRKQQADIRIPRTAIEKASVLLYELLRSPISQSRPNSFAVVALLFFLYERGYWMKISYREFYDFIMWIKVSNSINKKEMLVGINKMLEKYSYPI